MRTANGNFLTQHYEWIVAAVAFVALALAAVFFVQALGEDGELRASDEVRRIDSRKPNSSGVDKADMSTYQLITRTSKAPVRLGDVDPRGYSFLASDRRVFCAKEECHAPIPPDAKVCPVCNETQPEEPQPEVVLDADDDGLPDDWERKVGLNPGNPADADEDLDGDGFTNREEFDAGTDPSDRNSHPDYLDSLKIRLPLKQTTLPFYLRSYMKTPSGMKLEFFNPKERNDYGTLGRTYSVYVNADIGGTGYVVKGFEQKERTMKIAGGGGATRKVDVSFATIERKADGRQIKVAVSGDKPKYVPVDVQAVLVYSRGAEKELTVVPSDKINLNGSEYVVKEIKSQGKGAAVVLEDASGKTRTLEALEQ
jgi:hypothetical protein